MAIRYLSGNTANEVTNAATGKAIEVDAFRAVFDASAQGVLVHQCHKPFYVNHAWAALHGYEPGEIMARETVVDLLSPEDRDRMVNYNNDRLAGCPAPSCYHYQLVQKSGQLRWVEIFVQQMEWFGEPAIQCTVIDARPRDNAMAARLRRAEDTNEKFQSALEEASEGFALYGGDHRLLVWNRRFVEMMPELRGILKPDMTFEEVARIRLDLGAIAEAIGRESAWLEERLRSFGKLDSWIDLQNPDGRWYQISEKRLNDGCILITVIDITERRQAEEALASERTLLRAIIDTIPDAIYAKDQEARFILKNRFDAELMGAKTPRETIGKTDFEYYPKHLAEEMYADDLRVIEQGASIVRKEQRLVHNPNDEPRWLSVTKVPFRNADGEIIGLVGCSRDVTDRKAMEIVLAKHRDHLEELVAERTAEVERQRQTVEDALDKERELSALQRHFVSMVCHEFRTPLSVIDGSAQRILRRIDKIAPDRLRETLGKIRISVGRLTDLMESVLSAARLESGTINIEPHPCAPKDMILEIAANYRELNPYHEIVANLDDLPDMFVMDGKLLRQAISNLLSNAIKYSPDSTHVWIDGKTTDDLGMRISVRDEGVGIPSSEVERLFERFFRASTSTGIAGTGIGLNMVKTLVEMHEGKVSVTSEEGIGTTFIVDLPASNALTVEQTDCETLTAS